MFADPQSLTVNGTEITLPRVGSQNPARIGVFASADGNFTVQVSQNATNNRCRREFRVTQRKIAVDPISAVNKEVSASVILAIDEPKWGFTDAELALLTNAAEAAFTDGVRDKLLGGEL